MEIKIIWLMGVFLILICLALAIEQTTFSDGTSAKNLTFTSTGSKYINISLPNNVNVTNASLFLEGLRNTIIDDTENNYSYSGIEWSNPLNLVDQNWSSYGSWTLEHSSSNFYINYTENLTTTIAWKYCFGKAFYSNSYAYFWNYSSSTWQNVGKLDGTCSGSYPNQVCDTNKTINVLPDFVSGGTFQIKLNLYAPDYFFEESLILNDSYPTNITIKTDNVQVYQNLSEFNGSTTIDLNATILQDCIDLCLNPSGGNCLCELNFTSATAGILQLSNLNITYSMPPNSISFTNTTDWTGNYYTTDTPSRAVTINSTFGVNVTNCNLNVSASSLRSILTQNETNFTIENNSLKTVLVSFPTPSALDYSGHYLWAECDGNNKTSNINIEFSVANVPAPSTGGGGGGEVILITPNATKPILFFGLTVVDFTILRTPSQGVKEIPIRNIGNETFKGSITVEGNVKDYFTVELCNIDGEKCSFKDVEISYGETKLLVIKGIFDESIGEGKEGIIKFRSGEPERTLAYYQRTLGIADGNVQTFELGLTISRYPLYRVVNYLSGQLGVPEMAIAIGLIVIIGVIVGVIVVMKL